MIINCFLFYHGLIISHTAFNFLTKAGLFFMVIYTKSLFTWNFQLSKLCLIFIFLHNNFSSVFLLSGEDFTFNNWYIYNHNAMGHKSTAIHHIYVWKILIPMHKLLKTNLKKTMVVCTWTILHGYKDLFIAIWKLSTEKLYSAIF